jgi:hypothetical protein
MPSSEPLTCAECGPVEALNEHRRAEREIKKLRNTGFADG